MWGENRLLVGWHLGFQCFSLVSGSFNLGISRGGSETSWSFTYLHFGVSKSTFGYLVQLSQPKGIDWACLGQVLFIQHVLRNFVVNTLPCITGSWSWLWQTQLSAGAEEVWIQSVKDTEYLHCWHCLPNQKVIRESYLWGLCYPWWTSVFRRKESPLWFALVVGKSLDPVPLQQSQVKLFCQLQAWAPLSQWLGRSYFWLDLS